LKEGLQDKSEKEDYNPFVANKGIALHFFKQKVQKELQ